MRVVSVSRQALLLLYTHARARKRIGKQRDGERRAVINYSMRLITIKHRKTFVYSAGPRAVFTALGVRRHGEATAEKSNKPRKQHTHTHITFARRYDNVCANDDLPRARAHR